MGISRIKLSLRQSGATLVEFSVTVSLFLLLVLGVMELSIMVMELAKANELTREISRIAIISDPVCDIYDGGCGDLRSCPDPGVDPAAVIVILAATSCSADSTATECRMIRAVEDYLPAAEAANIELRYACSNTGLSFRPLPIPLVSVSLINYSRELMLGAFLGIDAAINFPAFEVTRTGEDLYTEREL